MDARKGKEDADMLVLSRKSREMVVIGGDGSVPVVTVTVLQIKGQVVRLGFQADASLPVHRWEVWQQLRNGNSAQAR